MKNQNIGHFMNLSKLFLHSYQMVLPFVSNTIISPECNRCRFILNKCDSHIIPGHQGVTK